MTDNERLRQEGKVAQAFGKTSSKPEGSEQSSRRRERRLKCFDRALICQSELSLRLLTAASLLWRRRIITDAAQCALLNKRVAQTRQVD
jgi:hypothetical protein